ncbi:response regulator, partial [Salinarimonas soli]
SARQDVRVVFTDINMPGAINGLDLAHAVKANWPGTGVLLTSGAPPQGALPAGARFLQKPFMPMVLVAAVQDLLAEARPFARSVLGAPL